MKIIEKKNVKNNNNYLMPPKSRRVEVNAN